jgi:hypothetical protein
LPSSPHWPPITVTFAKAALPRFQAAVRVGEGGRGGNGRLRAGPLSVILAKARISLPFRKAGRFQLPLE